MRLFFLLVFLAGAALGLGYPWYVNNLTGYAIGEWTVYERGKGFTPVTVRLDPSDAAVRVHLDMVSDGAPAGPGAASVVAIVVNHAGRTLLAETATFSAAAVKEDAPQQIAKTWRAFPGSFPVRGSGDYEVIVSDGAREEIPMRQITLTLRANSETAEPNIVYGGVAAMAIGAIGLVLSLRRRRGGPGGGANAGSKAGGEKPRLRWGRG